MESLLADPVFRIMIVFGVFMIGTMLWEWVKEEWL